jgi:hypothetical protein
MVRKQVIAKPKPYMCPVCPRQAYTLNGIAQHLAMSWEDAHVAWRLSHGLPERARTMVEVKHMKKKIEEIISKQK